MLTSGLGWALTKLMWRPQCPEGFLGDGFSCSNSAWSIRTVLQFFESQVNICRCARNAVLRELRAHVLGPDRKGRGVEASVCARSSRCDGFN